MYYQKVDGCFKYIDICHGSLHPYLVLDPANIRTIAILSWKIHIYRQKITFKRLKNFKNC